MQLSILFAILQDMAAEGLAGRYMNFAALRFVKAYGRRHYDDAAVWCRRIAECFCLIAVPPSYHEYLLGDLIDALPSVISWSTVYDVLKDIEGRPQEVAVSMGCQLTASTVWHDLKLMQWYGNQGTHAHAFLKAEPVSADPHVFLATVRLLLLFCAVYGDQTTNGAQAGDRVWPGLTSKL